MSKRNTLEDRAKFAAKHAQCGGEIKITGKRKRDPIYDAHVVPGTESFREYLRCSACGKRFEMLHDTSVTYPELIRKMFKLVGVQLNEMPVGNTFSLAEWNELRRLAEDDG